VRGTDDDAVREIRNGRFQLAVPPPAEPYEPSYAESTWDDPDFGVVVDIWIVVTDDFEEPYYQDTVTGDGSSGCSGDTTYDPYDESYESGGCEGDLFATDETGYDTGGCGSGSDTYEDTGSGGCEGDTSSDDSWGCGDDEYAAARPPRRLLALALPALAIFVTRSILKRRR
jgi:hypothetical protein